MNGIYLYRMTSSSNQTVAWKFRETVNKPLEETCNKYLLKLEKKVRSYALHKEAGKECQNL